MHRIFISYRRADSSDFSQNLYNELSQLVGTEQVFMDVANILPGEDFREKIKSKLDISDAILVVVGPDWNPVDQTLGLRRLDSPDDYVRIELEMALETKMQIIPISVPNASIPKADDLPKSLKTLAYLNFLNPNDSTEPLAKRIRSLVRKTPHARIGRDLLLGCFALIAAFHIIAISISGEAPLKISSEIVRFCLMITLFVLAYRGIIWARILIVTLTILAGLLSFLIIPWSFDESTLKGIMVCATALTYVPVSIVLLKSNAIRFFLETQRELCDSARKQLQVQPQPNINNTKAIPPKMPSVEVVPNWNEATTQNPHVMPLSKLGIVSFFLTIAVNGLVAMVAIIPELTGINDTPDSSISQFFSAALALSIVIAFAGNILALIMGLIGAFNKKRRRVFAYLGVTLSSLILSFPLILTITS